MLASTLRQFRVPATVFIESIVSNTTVRMLDDTATLLQDTVDFNLLETKLECVMGSVDNLTDISVVNQTLNEIEASVLSISDGIQGIVVAMDATKTQLEAVNVAVKNTHGTIDSIEKVQGNATLALDTLTAKIQNAELAARNLSNTGDPLGAAEEMALSAANVGASYPNDTVLSDASNGMAQLASGQMDGSTVAAAATRKALIGELESIRASLIAMGNPTIVSDSILAFNTQLDNFVSNNGPIDSVVAAFDRVTQTLAQFPSPT